MAVEIVFSPEAEADLLALYDYIAERATPDIALGFTDAIVDFCQGFSTFPNRGTRRDELRPGLRTTGFRHQVTIAFDIECDIVSIIGIYYGGRNFEAMLRGTPD